MDRSERQLRYTICFCVAGSKILVLRRKKAPYLHMWNGLGGKIEENEKPKENIIREMQEESEIDLRNARDLTFAGIVTWDSTRKEGLVYGGMYAYIATLDEKSIFEDRETREGLLSWKESTWLCDKENREVAENIFYFLPPMLSATTPKEYNCIYVFAQLTDFKTTSLSKKLIAEALI